MYNYLQSEKRVSQDKIHSIFKEAVEIEKEFITIFIYYICYKDIRSFIIIFIYALYNL